MKKYWLYLEPFTLIFSQKEESLIYNSISYEGRKFKNRAKLGKIISQLNDLGNMYCIELTEDEIKAKEVGKFVCFVRKSFSGDLVNSSKIKKPAIFPPVLKLQYNINILKTTSFRHVGEEILNLLSEVNIYVGGDNPSSSLNNIKVFKQFDYCKKTEGKYLTFLKMKDFLSSLKGCYLQNLNILGGNVFTYPDMNILIDELCKLSFTKCIYSAYRDIPDNLELYPFLKDPQFLLKVLIDFPINPQILDETIHFLAENNCKFELLFAITSINEYERAETIINKHNLKQTEIKPVFTGENIDFFKEYIYLSEEDVLQTQATRKEIFNKQSLNISSFGKIRIMTNGKVYSDLNKPCIGDIDTPLINMLHGEMSKSKSWLRIRNQKPCNSCVYQWLCPPPSGYEHVIGKSNLCTVK